MIKQDFDDFTRAPDDLSGGVTRTNAHQTDTRFSDAPELYSAEKAEEILQETDKETKSVSETLVVTTRLKVRNAVNETSEREKKSKSLASSCRPFRASPLTETSEKTSDLQDAQPPPPKTSDLKEVQAPSTESPAGPNPVEHARHAILRRSTSAVSRRTSTDSLYSSCVSVFKDSCSQN